MKLLHKYTLMALGCIALLLASCQNEDTLLSNSTGYLRLQMDVNTYADTKAYDPEQIAVQIVSANGEVVEETSDWTEWQDEQIALPVGTYTIKASSAGFDGNSGSQPYYAGSQTINIEKDKEVNTKITCTLANVKVTVKFDDSFKKHFTSAQVTVDDLAGSSAISPQTFNMDFDTDKSVYFPITDLSVLVQVKNQQGETHQQTNEITGVKARDHYILTYKVGEGEGDVNITVDPSYKTYEYTFTIPTTPSTQLATPTVNAWAKFAYVSGSVISSEDELAAENMVFQYRKKNTENWTSVNAKEESNSNYSATLSPLDANTTYECRMAYNDAEFISKVREFTTEEATVLYNGNFDEWNYGSGDYDQTWFADIAGNAGLGTSFWDSGNIGTSTYLTSLVGVHNPTYPENIDVNTIGGKAAKLESQFVGFMGTGKFAAGNIYTGNYCETFANPMGARIRFGKEFASRPIQLTGYYKYSRGTTIDEDNDATYTNILKQAGGDLCSVYIALTDNEGLAADNNIPAAAFEIDNRLSADEPENFKYKSSIDFSENNKHIIAYGTLSDEEAKGAADWTKFTIDLKYRDLTRKPKYIIIVASASKYGDYFTGSTSSVMYIDDFELIYDGNPAQ